MEIGVARFASVFPVAQKNVVIFSSYLQSAGLGREPDLRLKSKNRLDFRTSIGNPAWKLPELQVFPVRRKPHIHGFTNSTWHSSGALSSVRKYFYQDKLCKRCMQRYGLFDLPFSEELRCFSPARRHVKRRTVGSCTSGGIAEIQDAITAYWRPALEEILLISGIALAYVAGISNPAKPAQKSFLDQFRRKETSQGQDSTLPHSDSKAIKDKEQPHNCYYSESKMWDTLQEKIETAALQVQSDDVADYAAKEKFNASTLILEAIDRGPRLRLLLSTVEFLRKEFKRGGSTEQGCYPKEMLDLLSSSIGPIFQNWLSHEDLLIKVEDEKPWKEVLLSSMHSSLNKSQEKYVEKSIKTARNSTPYSQHTTSAATDEGIGARFDQKYIISRLAPLGKVQLYADFFFLIYSGSLRSGSCCSRKSFLKHSEAILEDLVITIADRVAEHYVNLVSINATGYDGNEWPLLLLPSILSTRSLESLRNQVALRSWFQQNFESVAAIYEDHMELWTLQDKRLVKSADLQQNRKKNLRVLDQDSEKDQTEIVVARCCMPVKRRNELKSLSGWRYYYSLYLEFSDIAGPVLKVVLSKLGEGISFLLVSLIGRSLGLIFQGIRQSIQWGSK